MISRHFAAFTLTFITIMILGPFSFINHIIKFAIILFSIVKKQIDSIFHGLHSYGL